MPTRVLPLAAASPETLRKSATAARSALESGVDFSTLLAPTELEYGTASPGPHRLALVVRDAADALGQLDAFLGGRAPSSAGRSPDAGAQDAPRVALLFTGQGAQYAGMAQGLAAAVPAFRAHLDTVAAALDRWLPGPILPVLRGDDDAPGDIGFTAWTQPALFCVEVAVARLLSDWGVRPHAVLGHSIGELAAACVAGVMSLEDAARLVVARGQRMGELPRGGAMVALQAELSVAEAAIEGLDGVDIAAINAPEQVVLSGVAEAVAAAQARAEAAGARGSRLDVSHAFHSVLMDPMLEDFAAVAQDIPYAPPDVALVTNVTGQLVAAGGAPAGGPTEPQYWVRHVRQAVRFAAGAAALEAHGCDLALEVGPHPVLTALVRRGGLTAPTFPLLRRKRADDAMLFRGLAAAWALGVPVDWGAVAASMGD